MEEEINCSKEELINASELSLNKFMYNVTNINHEYKVLNAIKNLYQYEVGSNLRVFLKITCVSNASEIQSAHFGASKTKIAIHTSVFYLRDLN